MTERLHARPTARIDVALTGDTVHFESASTASSGARLTNYEWSARPGHTYVGRWHRKVGRWHRKG